VDEARADAEHREVGGPRERGEAGDSLEQRDASRGAGVGDARRRSVGRSSRSATTLRACCCTAIPRNRRRRLRVIAHGQRGCNCVVRGVARPWVDVKGGREPPRRAVCQGPHVDDDELRRGAGRGGRALGPLAGEQEERRAEARRRGCECLDEAVVPKDDLRSDLGR